MPPSIIPIKKPMPDQTTTIQHLLKTIKQDTSPNTIYQFLIGDLEEQITFYARNTLYWKNQLSHMKQYEKFKTKKEKKASMKYYKDVIKANKKDIKCFKKSVKALQEALEQHNKGERHA